MIKKIDLHGLSHEKALVQVEEFLLMEIRRREINRIVESRPYGTIEDFRRAEGVGQRTLERLLDGARSRIES
mgnify:CR=1 FL=1